MMVNYYDLFVQLSLQQCLKNEYCDKDKMKIHNTASKKLQKLQEEMKKVDCVDMLIKLLNYNDDRVRINAAYFCLQMNMHKEKALQTLNEIVATTTDSTLAFSAKMALQNF